MKYVTPELETTRFSVEDILLASAAGSNEKEGYEANKSSIEWELD